MIIFFYGDDQFRSSRKLNEIRQKYLESDKSGSGLSSFDFSEKTNAQDIIDVFSMPNLLAPKRLVVIKRIFSGSETEQKTMQEYFKKNREIILEDKDLVVVFWEDSTPKKSNALFKLLDAISKKQNFEKLTGAKLNTWILKRLKELDKDASVSQTALGKLILYSGTDTLILDNELQKLVNYQAGKMIDEKAVEMLVKANLDANIFNTVDALGLNNKKQALKLLHDHLSRGDDPFYLLSMFIYQFRNLIKVASLKEKERLNEYEIAKLTKMHPFVIKKSLGQARNFSLARLREIYKSLSMIDTEVKTGKTEIKLALDKFVAEL